MLVLRSSNATKHLLAQGGKRLSNALHSSASQQMTGWAGGSSSSASALLMRQAIARNSMAQSFVSMADQRHFLSSTSSASNTDGSNDRKFSTAFVRQPVSGVVLDDVSMDQQDEINESKNQLGTVTRTLKKLDLAVVKKIEAELKQADTNQDGRLDHEDLRNLLKKHYSAFTDEEIVEFAELFYAGKAGGSVSFQDFIVALDNAASGVNNHPILDGNCSAEFIYRKSHATYTPEDLDIRITHVAPTTFMDKMALNAVKVVRFFFDNATGWNNKDITTDKILNRVIFLETIAAVPGMVAAICRHFKSLRNMERDGGLLHLFLEEANNERMHLLSFIKMKDPSVAFRAAVVFSQFGFGGAFLLSYLASPKFCHRFVGYIEEEACVTYTKIIEAIENAPEGSKLATWKHEAAPNIARSYWHLGENGTVLDLVYAVRADEAEHRDVNHAASQLRHGDVNPWSDPDVKLNQMLKRYVKDIMSRDDDITKLHHQK
eukprot:CAMPEP_0119551120 /NCGR_PEP_ID=MMETSP1352-20130426/4466_1 /TAXON_ID=265584 /ORGANISM="Stauroneis constricta, Strain CCMP1120" /LENGTH=488 /DNA_ID=CAMNT_0007597129 /DNA_START=65 /DNA_END=1531 /DNA_ORIENTATION=-